MERQGHGVVHPSCASHDPAAIFVVGAGVVGSATGEALASLGHDVTYVDSNTEKVNSLNQAGRKAARALQLQEHKSPSFVFVCVPTPSSQSGYDLQHLVAALESVGAELAGSQGLHHVVVRSTVAPLTYERVIVPTLERASGRPMGDGYTLAVAPEFLRQERALQDSLSPRVTVVASVDPEAASAVAELFAPLGGIVSVFADPRIAEVIKAANNAYNATKISYWNEIWMICNYLGVPQDEVAKVVSVSAEGSYNPDYGIRGGFAYGGACLPKDLDGLLAFCEEAGIEARILSATRSVNDVIRIATDADPTDSDSLPALAD